MARHILFVVMETPTPKKRTTKPKGTSKNKGKPIRVSEEIPVILKPNFQQQEADNSYLTDLLALYREQIAYLKDDIKVKNELILDLVNIKNCQNQSKSLPQLEPSNNININQVSNGVPNDTQRKPQKILT